MSDEKSIERSKPSAEDTDGELVQPSRSMMREFFMGSVRSGPAYHPIFDKFESQHVTQFLSQAATRDAARQKKARGDRWFLLVYVMVVVGVFLFLTWILLPDQSELYFQILQGIGVFGAGLAGGYGIKAYQDKRSGDQ